MRDFDESTLARAAAARLAADMPAGFAEAVEAELAAPDGSVSQPKSFDPGTLIALGALLVSIAQFAWAIYGDLKQQGQKPTRDVLTRRVRLRLEQEGLSDQAHGSRMVEVVVEEVIQRDS